MQRFCALALLTLLSSVFRLASSFSVLTFNKGESATLNCTRLSTDHNYIYWYRQYPGKGLDLLYYSYGQDILEEGDVKSPRFKASSPTIEHLSLEISNLEPQDSAMYFCASTRHSNNSPLHFGTGTKLTVLEKEPQEPKVSIFEPSVKEIDKKKKATLVCVAYDFYPDHVSITWKINGEEAKEGEFKTDDYPAENNKSYSQSSRLRLSASRFLNANNYFECVVSFTLNETKQIKEGIHGREACGVTPEIYRKGTNAGKFTFLLLLSKSALYGFIMLTVIMWQVKVSSDKNFN